MKTVTWAAGLGMSLLLAATALGQATSRPGAGFERSGRPGGANGATNGGERPGMMLLERARQMLDDLKLTDDQKTKVDAIFKKAKADLDAMRESIQAMEPRERFEKIQQFAKDVRDDLAKVLDDTQRAAMDKKLEEAKQNMRGRFGGNAPNGPSSRPSGARPPNGPAGAGGPGAMAERLRDSLAKLDLSAEQKAKIKDVFDEIQAKAQQLRQEAQNGSQDAREKMRDLFQQTRDKLGTILTPSQQEKLRGMMRTDGPPTSRPGQAKVTGENGETMAGDMKDADMAGAEKGADKVRGNARERFGDRARRGGNAQAPADNTNKAAAANVAKVGDPAPSLVLKKIDGALVQLSSLKGRVIVLEFGSWTCPAFRERAAAMEKLKNDVGQRAQFFIIYTREAHAKGEWEVARNKDLEISVDQPRTIEARADLAKKAKQELKITVPIVLDTIGNDTSIAYGAGANTAVVISRDGTIAARQEWFDPSGLRRDIDEATKAGPVTKPGALPAVATE